VSVRCPPNRPRLTRSNYIADAYETYSSSAQASQSLVRNMFGAVFPLFARKMVSCLEGTSD